MIACIIFAALVVLYVLSTMCRRGHKGLNILRSYVYAHRGLHSDGIPENSLAAFRKAKEAGYGIELDVHLLADGSLAVMHDSALQRTTGQEGFMEDLRKQDLSHYRLEGTEETIPLLSDVLDLYKGAAPLIIELKCSRNNYAQLCTAATDLLDGYCGPYCMESFDPRCICWLRKNRPDIIRGQLTENYFKSKTNKLPWLLKFVLRHQMLNFLSLPDFVAYRYPDRKTFSNSLVRKLWGAMGVSWTLKTPEEYQIALDEHWIPIFEGFNP